jgi:hypothetical protein
MLQVTVFAFQAVTQAYLSPPPDASLDPGTAAGASWVLAAGGLFFWQAERPTTANAKAKASIGTRCTIKSSRLAALWPVTMMIGSQVGRHAPRCG